LTTSDREDLEHIPYVESKGRESKKEERGRRSSVSGERDMLAKLVDQLGHRFLNEDRRTASLKLRFDVEETEDLLTLYGRLLVIKDALLEALT
jgi:hypothetical protein